MKKLNDKELNMLELNDLKHKNAKLECLLEQKAFEVLNLKQRLLGVELSKIQQRVDHLKNIEANFLEQKKDFVQLMAKKHKIEGKWGYDPNNGEIKED